MYSLSDNSWSELTLAASPSPRSSHCGGMITSTSGQQYYCIFGGILANLSTTNEVWCLDMHALVWIHKTPSGIPPAPRAFHSCNALGTKLVIAGGENIIDSKTYQDVWIYGFSTDSFLNLDADLSPSQPLSAHAAVLYVNSFGMTQLSAFGGEGLGSTVAAVFLGCPPGYYEQNSFALSPCLSCPVGSFSTESGE